MYRHGHHLSRDPVSLSKHGKLIAACSLQHAQLTQSGQVACRAGCEKDWHLEAFLHSQLLLFSMGLLQAEQLLLCLAADLADVGIVFLSLLQLHLHFGQLLLEVVQLHTNGLPPRLGMLQDRNMAGEHQHTSPVTPCASCSAGLINAI